MRSRWIRNHWAAILLTLFIAIFIAGFYAISVRQLQAQIPEKADLGQMMLAAWNTSQGRFVQEVKGEQISTRLTDHVEPIFIPVSLALRLWKDVRALLLIQVAALALGAIPIFRLSQALMQEGGIRRKALLDTTALTFAFAYLMFPALQAPMLADFHAIPLAAPIVAFALWFAHGREWRKFLIATLILLTVKEEAALLAFFLGAWAVLRYRAWRVGLVVCLLSIAWFVTATFVIVPHYAQTAYDEGQSVYFQRYGELGDSPAGIVKALLTQPDKVFAILTEHSRLVYLAGLLASVGFLALLAPEIILLSFPLLAANILSGYQQQYSGELHYSAPLVPYVVIAAIFGLKRLLGWTGDTRRRLVLVLALAWLLVWSVGYGLAEGFTPLGHEYTWPDVSPHHRLLARFTRQIPSGAPGSVTTGLFPHLAQREKLYPFPSVADADWILLDVIGPTAMHPADLKRRFEELLASGQIGIRDAADGYILLIRGEERRALPDTFYDFARVPDPKPQRPARILFDNRLLFLGYDLKDNGKEGMTSVRTYWQAEKSLDASLRPWPFFVGPNGAVVEDTTVRPSIAILWLPPDRWQVGETIVVETLPWFLPPQWAVAVGVLDGAAWEQQSDRWPARCLQCDGVRVFSGDTWARLDGYRRQGRDLLPLAFDAKAAPRNHTDASFQGGILLQGYDLAPMQTVSGSDVQLVLYWQVSQQPALDYQVFIHLRDEGGDTVVWADSSPAWYGPRPVSGWQPGETIQDAHTISLPADLSPGRYRVVIGLYDWRTGERLPLASDIGDEITLGTLDVQRHSE